MKYTCVDPVEYLYPDITEYKSGTDKINILAPRVYTETGDSGRGGVGLGVCKISGIVLPRIFARPVETNGFRFVHFFLLWYCGHLCYYKDKSEE